MSDSKTQRPLHPVWFSVALPVSWLAGLLSIGIVQLLVDPDAQDSSGRFLDVLSWYVWMAGLVLVPAVSAFFTRRHDIGWPVAFGGAVLASLVYVGGTILVFAIWVAGYEGATGTDWI